MSINTIIQNFELKCVEIGAHFLALSQNGHVRYPIEGIYERSSAAFIIILGGGLDNITEGFQLVVGNIDIGRSGAGLIFAGAIAFITQYSLYFEMTKGHTISMKTFGYCRRALAWFIAHFVYFSSLIIMLQAIAALLKFGVSPYNYNDILVVLNCCKIKGRRKGAEPSPCVPC